MKGPPTVTVSNDPRALYPEFYTNPAVRALAGTPRWTISGRIDDDPEGKHKAPIDLCELVRNGRVRGAWSISEQCLVDLHELTERVPCATNTAYYLRAASDGLIVIDIEPDCPEEIAKQILSIPGLLYIERSMSTLGFHALAALPVNFYDFPVAADKRVLREAHGWYEILLDHWVTFTRWTLSADELIAPAEQPLTDLTSVEALYASLAALAKRGSTAASSSIIIDSAPQIHASEQIVTAMVTAAQPRLKQPSDFNHDLSRYEFSVLNILYQLMLPQLVGYVNYGASYSAGDQAWLVYQAATRVLPPRAKHNERRNGRAFLLDRAVSVVAEQKLTHNRVYARNR